MYAVDLPKYRLLINTAELRSLANNDSLRRYLKILVLELNGRSLGDVIKEFVPGDNVPHWRISLIENADLLARAKGKILALSDDQSTCYLLPSSRVSASAKGRALLITVCSPSN